jgi:hypothetical protein
MEEEEIPMEEDTDIEKLKSQMREKYIREKGKIEKYTKRKYTSEQEEPSQLFTSQPEQEHFRHYLKTHPVERETYYKPSTFDIKEEKPIVYGPEYPPYWTKQPKIKDNWDWTEFSTRKKTILK